MYPTDQYLNQISLQFKAIYLRVVTLFLGLSRLILRRPMPLRTYFMEDNKLSNTAGCNQKRKDNLSKK